MRATVGDDCHARDIVSHFGHFVGDVIHLHAVNIFVGVSKVLVFTGREHSHGNTASEA